MPRPALIVLEDGASFAGEALVGEGTVGGELVFTTSMTGYQEIATDPSYAGQIVTYTFPMNGNYGADAARDEAARAYARAVVARELTNYRYNRASSQTWLDWLAEHDVLAVSGVDTRALTRHVREAGALRAVVVDAGPRRRVAARRKARRLPSMAGLDLAGKVTCEERFERPADGDERFHVVVYDFGVKRSMLALPRGRAACGVTVVPATASAQEVLRLAAGRRLSLERPRRPRGGDVRGEDGPAARRQGADLRHLPRPPAARARARAARRTS